MVETHTELQALSLEELSGVIDLYPWFAGARMELCRRMSAMSPDEFAAQALYVADRSKFCDLLRGEHTADYSDKDAAQLLASFLSAPSESAVAESRPVRVVGGDYFSQAQYDDVREGGDSIFSRMAGQMHQEAVAPVEDKADIADRFTTETLARIFVEQGLTEEAKRIYSRLILDIPEKSAYFASLIEKLDSLEQ